MPTTTQVGLFLLVLAILSLAALALMLLDEYWEQKWAGRIADAWGRWSSMIFGAFVASLLVIEGGSIMISGFLRKKEIEQARQQGHDEERHLWEEAERTKKENESLREARDRVERERRK